MEEKQQTFPLEQENLSGEKGKGDWNRKKRKKSFSGKSFLAGIFCTLAVGILFGAGLQFLPEGLVPDLFGIRSFEKMRTMEEIIDRVYAGEYTEEDLNNGMYRGLVNGLGDRYSAYYSKEEYESIRTAQDGYYEGIGITVILEDNALLVKDVQNGTPAEKAGVRTGDRIIRIDGSTLEGLSLSDAVNRLKENGSDTVTITIEREEEKNFLELELKKEKLEAVTADGKMLDDAIGYLAISEFTALTPEQFQKAYASLQDQGMERLIIDLRGNPGGLVSSVCDTLRQILPKGLMVYTEDKNGKRQEYQCDGKTPIDLPLVVLVNENTASAAEIFTGAVKDYQLGTVVGMTTFGKGVVQNPYRLPDGSVIKLTIAHYYTPLGSDINGVGITPDVECELPENAKSDVQLEKAIEEVKQLSR